MVPIHEYNIPRVKDLCDQLGFNSVHLSRKRDLLTSLESWSCDHITTNGQPVKDLVDWHSHIRGQLWQAAADFLYVHGRHLFPEVKLDFQRETHIYPRDREKIAGLLCQLIWRQNVIYAHKGAQETDQQAEQAAINDTETTTEEDSSVGDLVPLEFIHEAIPRTPDKSMVPSSEVSEISSHPPDTEGSGVVVSRPIDGFACSRPVSLEITRSKKPLPSDNILQYLTPAARRQLRRDRKQLMATFRCTSSFMKALNDPRVKRWQNDTDPLSNVKTESLKQDQSFPSGQENNHTDVDTFRGSPNIARSDQKSGPFLVDVIDLTDDLDDIGKSDYETPATFDRKNGSKRKSMHSRDSSEDVPLMQIRERGFRPWIDDMFDVSDADNAMSNGHPEKPRWVPSATSQAGIEARRTPTGYKVRLGDRPTPTTSSCYPSNSQELRDGSGHSEGSEPRYVSGTLHRNFPTDVSKPEHDNVALSPTGPDNVISRDETFSGIPVTSVEIESTDRRDVKSLEQKTRSPTKILGAGSMKHSPESKRQGHDVSASFTNFDEPISRHKMVWTDRSLAFTTSRGRRFGEPTLDQSRSKTPLSTARTLRGATSPTLGGQRAPHVELYIIRRRHPKKDRVMWNTSGLSDMSIHEVFHKVSVETHRNDFQQLRCRLVMSDEDLEVPIDAGEQNRFKETCAKFKKSMERDFRKTGYSDFEIEMEPNVPPVPDGSRVGKREDDGFDFTF